MFKVSADPYGTKGGDDDDVINVTNGDNSNSSQVHFEPVRERQKKKQLRKADTMTETYKRSVQTAIPENSSNSSLSLKSTEKKLKKLRKIRASPSGQDSELDGQYQHDTMVPSKPPLVNAKAKNQGGCFSCFCMPTVMGAGKNSTTKQFVPLNDPKSSKLNQVSMGNIAEEEPQFLLEKKARR